MRIYNTFLFVLFLFSFVASSAMAEEVFEVRGINVDVSADNAVQAREQAFAKAQVTAFGILTERLLSAGEKENFIMPEASAISTLVEDFEVTNEQLSAVRYIATYNFNFRSEAVRDFIKGQDVAYTDVRSKPVLLLPFIQSGANMLIWRGSNPWRDAWNRGRTYEGLVPVIVPIGDAQDLSDISDNRAFDFDALGLARMTERYGAGEAMVVTATPVGDPASPQALQIKLYRTDRGRADYLNGFNVPAQSVRRGQTIYDAGVEQVKKILQGAWKQQTLVSASQQGALKAIVSFRNVQEWVETQRVLKNVQGVQDVNLTSLKPGRAELELAFQGSENRLRLALSQANVTLNPLQNPLQAASPVANAGFGRSWRQPAPVMNTYELYLNKFRY